MIPRGISMVTWSRARTASKRLLGPTVRAASGVMQSPARLGVAIMPRRLRFNASLVSWKGPVE